MRSRLWPVVVTAVLISAACGDTTSPAATHTTGRATTAGAVTFVSSQGQPANEAQQMSSRVLTGFSGQADFISSPTAAQDGDKVTAEQKAGKGTIDVLALQHGDFTSLGASDALTDLTPLLQRLEKDRQFPSALIDYGKQVAAAAAIGFFPVVEGVKMTGSDAPAYLNAEAGVAAKYAANKNAVVALLPVGLGTTSDQFTLVYQDTFTRIILRNEDIQTVLSDEETKLQGLLDTARAPCWPPDPPSTGTCQIK